MAGQRAGGPTKPKPVPVPVDESEPLRMECEHFLECIRTRQLPLTDGEEGVRVLTVLNACQEALQNGRPVAMSRSVGKRARPRPRRSFMDTAVIDDDVELGPGTKVWALQPHHAGLPGRGGVQHRPERGHRSPGEYRGRECKIQNNVSVYEGVTLEEDVFCGPSMVFTNVFNPRSHIRRMKELRPTLVKKGVTIGANATIICGNTLGEYGFIGAGAVVTMDVPAYALMVGNPAQQKGWMCACGVRLLDDLTCPECLAAYEETPGGIQPLKETP